MACVIRGARQLPTPIGFNQTRNGKRLRESEIEILHELFDVIFMQFNVERAVCPFLFRRRVHFNVWGRTFCIAA